ncbi:MAG: hypothetical protein JST46_07290 [Bacteroidetes bacterium]|nr:hypothetical protein [Bacteroidota bacterium]
MRWVYFLIVIFLGFCAFLTRWYLCTVKGLCILPADQVAGDKLVAIIEILLGLLTAFLIGFGVAWLFQNSFIRTIREHNRKKNEDLQLLHSQVPALQKENRSLRKQFVDFQNALSLLQQERRQWDQSNLRNIRLQDELDSSLRRYDHLKRENDELRERLEELRKQLEESRQKKVHSPQASTIATMSSPEVTAVTTTASAKSRFTPSSWQTKDDLTRISGIGPVIQRKLNKLGFFTFQQISELDAAQIERISKGIKFFPRRIGRDNWIGQAIALVRRHQ